MPPHLRRPVDIFILQLGVNDLFRSVPVARIQDNLQTIIDQVRSKNPGVRIIIAGLEVPNYSAEDYVAAFIQMYADLAKENGVTLVPSLLEGVGKSGSDSSGRAPPERGRAKNSRANRLALSRADRARGCIRGSASA